MGAAPHRAASRDSLVNAASLDLFIELAAAMKSSTGPLKRVDAIVSGFGSSERFQGGFITAGVNHFGSARVWLASRRLLTARPVRGRVVAW
jgi:superoxide dismutase